jgi:dihydroorotate dehydrogenase
MRWTPRALVISAPFGNYIRPAGATPTLGTFTLHRRRGRWHRVLRTVRYMPRLGAWVNRIGLRNPGVGWLESRVASGREKLSEAIVSVHGFDDAEWRELIARVAALHPGAIELNVSCPNVGELSWPEWLFGEAEAALPGRVIVKVPPVRYEAMVRDALGAGVRMLHCCNTLPVPGGGMSGKPLMPLALVVIGRVRAMAYEMGLNPDDLTIIGGGGITGPADVDAYADAGADRVAIGTKVFHPKYLWSDAGARPILERAVARFG